MRLDIAIIGAGIGGLSAAIALAMKGHQVTIFERADVLKEVGAGIQIAPNGYHVLQALGVVPLLQSSLFLPEAIEMRLGISGRKIFSLPIQDVSQSRWHAPYLHIHRADLLAALHQHLMVLAPEALQLGQSFVGYQNIANNQVQITVGSGKTIPFDLVIGADGVHSGVRAQMHGPEQPRFTGNVAWRTTVPIAAYQGTPPPPNATIWVGEGCHAVTTRIKAGNSVNFVGMVEQQGWQEDGWNIAGSKEEALAHFGHWHPSLSETIEQSGNFHKWALLDRAPLPFWTDGRATLLGDAAHPMLPSMAQGAVQAMEDGFVLAECLDILPLEQALAQYFDQRIARVSKIQAGSAKNVALFHRRNSLAKLLTYGPMFLAGALVPNAIHRRQDWVYGHDVTQAVRKIAR